MNKYIYNGVEITYEDAEACNYGTNGEVVYSAVGYDADGNRYTLAWNTTDEWNNAQFDEDGDPVDGWRWDESYACDWDNPVAVDMI